MSQPSAGGSEVDVHATKKDLSSAVELHAGLDGDVTGEDDLRPGSRAIGGRCVAEVLVVEVGEGLVGPHGCGLRLATESAIVENLPSLENVRAADGSCRCLQNLRGRVLEAMQIVGEAAKLHRRVQQDQALATLPSGRLDQGFMSGLAMSIATRTVGGVG
jgi:hypothetical protein